MRSSIWLLAAVASACGGDGGGGTSDAPLAADGPPPGVCGAAGNGLVNGTIEGAAIAPVVRASQVTIPGAGVAIVIDEAAGSCGQPVAAGEHLVLGFCDAPTAKTYTVVGEQQFACPGASTFGLVEQNGSTDFAESLSGTITVTAVTSTCVTGTFDISFRPAGGPGTPASLAGSFNAVICP